MFVKGEAIVYGSQGVCVIDDVSVMSFGKEKREYYILKPIYEENSTIYAPTDSEVVTSKMRKVMTESDIEKLFDCIASEKIDWIDDETVRRKYCETVISSGDRKEIMKLVGMLYTRQIILKAQKKHLHSVDEKYLKESEKIINDEVAYVMKIERNMVSEYMLSRFGENSSSGLLKE